MGFVSLKPGQYNILLQRRADFSLPLEFKDSAGAPINFTNWGGYAQVWDKTGTTKYADFVVDFTDRALGQIEISMERADTEGIPCEAYWDLLLENPSAKMQYYLEGMVYVSEGYTRPEA